MWSWHPETMWIRKWCNISTCNYFLTIAKMMHLHGVCSLHKGIYCIQSLAPSFFSPLCYHVCTKFWCGTSVADSSQWMWCLQLGLQVPLWFHPGASPVWRSFPCSTRTVLTRVASNQSGKFQGFHAGGTYWVGRRKWASFCILVLKGISCLTVTELRWRHCGPLFSSWMCSHHVMGNSSYLDMKLMVTVMMEPGLQHL